MWQRFTERARRTVFFAQEEAGRLGESYVSTEHLLLGLVRENDTVAGRILNQLGVSPESIRLEVEGQVTQGDALPDKGTQLTPGAKSAIDLAYEESRLLNNNYIGTEHLLLGLIREREGMAGRVLHKMGVLLEPTRAEVILLQKSNPSKDTGGSSGQLASTQTDIPTDNVVEEVWQRLAESAKRAFLPAHLEAVRLKHDTIATEHLLLGLIHDDDSSVVATLKRIGASPIWIRKSVEWFVTTGNARANLTMRLTKRASHVFDLASVEAKQAGKDLVEPEHLLLGLILDEESAVSRVLLKAGVSLERVRLDIARQAGTSVQTPIPDPAAGPQPVRTQIQDAERLLKPSLSALARHAIHAAISDATASGATLTTVEHLLSTLLIEQNSTARLLLERLEVPVDSIQAELKESSKSELRSFGGEAKWSPAFRNMLNGAANEALEQKPPIVRTEHLLLAIVQATDTLASKILTGADATVDRIRDAMLLLDEVPLEVDTEPGQIHEDKRNLADVPAPWKRALEQLPVRRKQLTERAIGALVAAQQVAAATRSDSIGVEHVVLALARGSDTIATRVLHRMDVPIDDLVQEVDASLTVGAADGVPETLTPHLRAALEVAYAESRELNNQFIGTEHILLGLLHSPRGVIGQILNKFDLTANRVRQMLAHWKEDPGAAL